MASPKRKRGISAGPKSKRVRAINVPPEMAGRVKLMQEWAESAVADGETFVYIRIPENIGPLDRGDKYENPIIDALNESALGRCTGGGQQLGEGNSMRETQSCIAASTSTSTTASWD